MRDRAVLFITKIELFGVKYLWLHTEVPYVPFLGRYAAPERDDSPRLNMFNEAL